MRLSGKRALMIGAATGIGRACVEDFARNGATVAIADINAAGAVEAAALARSLGARASSIECNVLEEASVRDTVIHAEKEMEGIDTLICFAGMMRTAQVEDVEINEWDAIFDVNARGTFLVAKYGASALKRAGGGSFVTTASLAGLRGAAGMSVYAASKGAVIAFTVALAQELAPFNIRVNSVLPGWIDTPFNDPAVALMGGKETHGEIVRGMIPLGRQGTPADVAPMYTFLASEESRYITAKSMMVDGGMAH
jgi:dihydroanticapsin dehydrogenase